MKTSMTTMTVAMSPTLSTTTLAMPMCGQCFFFLVFFFFFLILIFFNFQILSNLLTTLAMTTPTMTTAPVSPMPSTTMAGVLFVFFFCVFFLILFFLDTNYFTDDTSHEDPNDNDGCHITNAIDDNASIFLFFFSCILIYFLK